VNSCAVITSNQQFNCSLYIPATFWKQTSTIYHMVHTEDNVMVL